MRAIVLALFLLAAPFAAGPSLAAGSEPGRPSVLDARVGVHAERTRFVMELSDATEFRIALHSDPYRIVIESAAGAWADANGEPGRGLVARIRGGGAEGGGNPVVLDLSGPVRIAQAFVIPPRDGRQHRLVIDLEAAAPGAFAAEQRRLGSGRPVPDAPSGPAQRAAPVQPAVVQTAPSPFQAPPIQSPAQAQDQTTPVVARPASPPGDAVRGTAPVPRSNPGRTSRRTVVLDPGHGGEDPGAIAVTGMYEKDLTLKVARALAARLEATGRYRVVLTRDRDVFVRLRDRVAIARDAGADLFLSLHADSIDQSDMRGMSIYTLSQQASDREAAMMAARENRADAVAGLKLADAGDEVAGVLMALAQRHTLNQSRRFANLLVDHLGRDFQLVPRPHRSAGFAVLTAPDVPAVLVEMGYLSSQQDAKLLASGAHQERVAKALAGAVDGFFSRPALTRRP
ncbi:MAG TPA: N-acetylmuramoyl-L-alanine amidase [Azospirillaceae bacterium]|nr:N-acetylmuramoyl-L-alanine amidase [Azospirillaceae bacterium]